MTTIMFLFEHGHVSPGRERIVLSEILIMSAFFILVTVSILVAFIFLGAFIWSVYTDQYSDKAGSAMRMLFDDDTQNIKK